MAGESLRQDIKKQNTIDFSDKKKKTSSKSVINSSSESVSEFIEVNGKHLSDIDPNYWKNGLTEKQRNGYDKERINKFIKYLLENE